jgi:hypothetical protein
MRKNFRLDDLREDSVYLFCVVVGEVMWNYFHIRLPRRNGEILYGRKV